MKRMLRNTYTTENMPKTMEDCYTMTNMSMYDIKTRKLFYMLKDDLPQVTGFFHCLFLFNIINDTFTD